jgi:hypothetical protein
MWRKIIFAPHPNLLPPREKGLLVLLPLPHEGEGWGEGGFDNAINIAFAR